MRKGTRVGDAYVKVTADGDSINKDIVDDLDDASGDISKKGDEHGQEYGDSFSEGFTRNFRSNMPKVTGRLAGHSRRMGRDMGGDAGDASGDAFAERMESMVDRLGKRIGKSLGKSIGKSLEREVGGLEQRIGQMVDNLKNELGSVSGNRGGGSSASTGEYAPPPVEVRRLESAYRMDKTYTEGRERMYAAMFDKIAAREQKALTTTQKAREATERMYAAMFDKIERRDAQHVAATQRAREATERMYARLFDLAEKRDSDHLKQVQKNRDKTVDMYAKMFDQIEAEEKKNLTAETKRRAKAWADTANAHTKYLAGEVRREKAAAAAIAKAEAKAEEIASRAAQKRWADTANAYAKYLAQRKRGVIDEQGYSVSGNQRDSDISGFIGKLFGKGSRNNFLNLMGSAVGGITSGLVGMGKAAYGGFKLFSDGAANAVELASKAGETLSTVQKASAGFRALGTGIMTSLVRTGPLAVVAIAAIIGAMVLLTSVISGLIGIITALSSTIVSGLVGAMAVALPLFGSLIAAAGLLTAAFMSMTNEQQRLLKEAFTPLKEMMVGIGQQMLGPMVNAFDTWSKNLQRALQPLSAHARAFGQAFADAGNIITRSLSGPGWTAFIQSLGVYLPGIIRNLTRAFGGFMNGLMGMFSVILPHVATFSRYLADVGARFSAWANSAQGRNSIADFVTRAVNSLKSLWGAVRQIGGLIADVLFNPKVQRAGNGMFDGIAREVRKIRDAFARASADGSLQRWLDSAARFGRALWGVIKALFNVFRTFQSSGVLDRISGMLENMSRMINFVTNAMDFAADITHIFASALGGLMGPLGSVSGALGALGDVADRTMGLIGGVMSMIPGLNSARASASAAYSGPGYNPGAGVVRDGQGRSYSTGRRVNGRGVPLTPRRSSWSIPRLIDSGNTALNNTYEEDGGYMPDPNPYDTGGTPNYDYARQARQQAAREAARRRREAAAERRRLAREANKAVQENVRLMENAKTMADFRSARSTSMDALEQVTGRRGRRSRRVFRNLTRVNEARGARIGTADFQDSPRMIRNMIKNTDSLGTIAYARAMVTRRLEKANEKLRNALSLKADFKKAVADNVKAYGSILTAEAQTVNGVQQALTAGDITKNLQDRLTKIKQFNANMQILLAQGLSNAAYKQLMEGGVEGSADAAAALVAGGQGAVQQVNSLVAQIGSAGNAMGEAASSRLYQAGIDAARGLVAGLESMDTQLDRAAERIGNRISRKIKESLGIKSPSRVMMENMGYVGEGLVKGLDKQHKKVESATARLATRIAVSPEVANYAASQGKSPVSGNSPLFRDFVVQTPTEDPKAVAAEALNEMTARLP